MSNNGKEEYRISVQGFEKLKDGFGSNMELTHNSEMVKIYRQNEPKAYIWIYKNHHIGRNRVRIIAQEKNVRKEIKSKVELFADEELKLIKNDR